jgi:hypothetical protein
MVLLAESLADRESPTKGGTEVHFAMGSVSGASKPILEWAEKRVVALRRAQQIRSEQHGLGVTARVTWRPPPGPRSHVLTPKFTSLPLKRASHVTPKLMGSQSAQELLELSFGNSPQEIRKRFARDQPAAVDLLIGRAIDRSLQAQIDEAACVRAHLEAELAERTASASMLEQACHARFSQLEQECTRMAAVMLEERTACEAEKDALEAALAHERARLSMVTMNANAADAAAADAAATAAIEAAAVASLQLQVDEARAALKAQAESTAALRAQVDEAACVRAHLEAELAERTASASQLEQAWHARVSQLEQECTRMAAEMLEERTACEAEKGVLEAEAARCQVQAVDSAVASAMAKERTRARMASIVKALIHAADKKAAVNTAIATMQKKLALSYALRGAAKATKHAEETAEAAEESKRAQEATNAQALSAEEAAQAAEEAVRAQEGAIKQAIDSTREECARELDAAVKAAEAAAAQRVAAAVEALSLEHERAKLSIGMNAADAVAALRAQVDEAARVRAHLEAELAERTASALQLEQAWHARVSQLEQECTRMAAEMLEERTACEAEKDALKAALERNRSRLRGALKASMTLGLVALGVTRDGERTSRTSGADEAAFEAATRSEPSNTAQEELWRARRQFASEVRKLRLGLKLMLTLGLAIKDARAASG